jgi:hypothetical protein
LLLAMCPAFLPVAIVPLWHEKQLPTTCVWSTRVAGDHATVEWHVWQFVLDWIWAALLPVAVVPLWQE